MADAATNREDTGKRIDYARKKQGLTLSLLAERAGYDERTIRNVIRGRSTRMRTVLDICKVLEISVEEPNDEWIEIADKLHGGYTRHHYDHYIGSYLAYRRSFTFKENIVRSLYDISWSEQTECLTFKEYHEYVSPELKRSVNYSQEGEIFISNTVGLVHLLTRHEGALRLITLTKLHQNNEVMQGVVLTQAQRSFFFQPSVSCIVLKKMSGHSRDHLIGQVSTLTPDMPEYKEIDGLLGDTERDVSAFALQPPV